MKRLIKLYVIELFTLLLVSRYFQGIVFQNGIKTIAIASLALGISSIVVKPVVNVLLLPLNLVTFGVFKWLSSVVALYLVMTVVKDFVIEKFYFSGLSTKWIDIPQINLNGWLAIIAFSLIISIVTSSLGWLLK